MRPGLVAILLTGLLPGCDDAEPPLGAMPPSDRGTIRGTVVELGTGRFLDAVRIKIDPGERVTGTDAEGRYAIDNLPIPADGLEYRVRAVKPGFSSVTGSTVLSPTRSEATVNFQLTRQASIVSGTTR